VSPRTRLGIESAEAFVRRNFADNPDAARQYVAVYREQATARQAQVSTGDERRIAAALHRAADAAETAILEFDGAAV
jgi:hypothetical protein